MIHHSNVGLLAECRWYGHLFLERIKAEVPFSEKLGDAAGCFMDIHDTMWKVWNAVGGMGVNATKAKKFTDPQIRIQVAGLLKEARRLDEKALSYLKSAIGKQ